MATLRHTGITTQNMQRSLELFRDVFGFEVVWDEIEQSPFIDRLTGMSNVKVHTVKLKDSGGSMVELLHFMSHPDENSDKNKTRMLNRVGCSHIAVTVNNIKETYENLLARGFVFNNVPERHPDINVPATVAYCRDPEGTLIEIVEVTK